jgi:hypothetical protein
MSADAAAELGYVRGRRGMEHPKWTASFHHTSSARTRFGEHQRLPKRTWLLGQEIVVCLSLQECFVIVLVGHHVWHLARNEERNWMNDFAELYV